jgi:hypothetical protein
MEKPALTRANLSDVRVIMAIMRVLIGGVAISGDDGMDSST